MIKFSKFKDDSHISEFIEGSDKDEHYQIQGDFEISGVMYEKP
jgi:hypothetical protein